MVPNKTVYVRDEDVPVGEAAAASAGEGNLSSYVTESLRQRLAQRVPSDELARIVVELDEYNDYGEYVRRMAFYGRWLVHVSDPDEEEWGVAVTRKGKFVFYSHAQGLFEVLDNLEDVRGRVAEDAYEVAISALNIVEELDI